MTDLDLIPGLASYQVYDLGHVIDPQFSLLLSGVIPTRDSKGSCENSVRMYMLRTF